MASSTAHQPWNFGMVQEKEGQCLHKFNQSPRDRSHDVLLWREYFRDPSQW
eukprot:c45478_g1_i1 orf=1-150(-)